MAAFCVIQGIRDKIPIIFPYAGLLRPQVKKYGNKEEILNFDISV